MSPLSDVLSLLSDEINMQEDLSLEMCPHKPSSRLSESPLHGGGAVVYWIEPLLWIKWLRVQFPSMPGTFVFQQDT